MRRAAQGRRAGRRAAPTLATSETDADAAGAGAYVARVRVAAAAPRSSRRARRACRLSRSSPSECDAAVVGCALSGGGGPRDATSVRLALSSDGGTAVVVASGASPTVAYTSLTYTANEILREYKRVMDAAELVKKGLSSTGDMYTGP